MYKALGVMNLPQMECMVELFPVPISDFLKDQFAFRFVKMCFHTIPETHLKVVLAEIKANPVIIIKDKYACLVVQVRKLL